MVAQVELLVFWLIGKILQILMLQKNLCEWQLGIYLCIKSDTYVMDWCSAIARSLRYNSIITYWRGNKLLWYSIALCIAPLLCFSNKPESFYCISLPLFIETFRTAISPPALGILLHLVIDANSNNETEQRNNAILFTISVIRTIILI